MDMEWIYENGFLKFRKATLKNFINTQSHVVLKSVSEAVKFIFNCLHFWPVAYFTKHFTSTATVIVLVVDKSATVDQKMEILYKILNLG